MPPLHARRRRLDPLAHVRLAPGLALVLGILCGCPSEPSPGFQPPPGQRRERLEITISAAEPVETPEEDVRNSQNNVLRVLGSVHDAVTAPIDGPLEVEMPASSSRTFATAVALTGWPKGRAVPHDVSVRLEVEFSGGAARAAVGEPLPLPTLLSGWTPIVLDRGTEGPVRLRLRATLVGPTAPAAVPGLRLALSVPSPEVLARGDAGLPNVLILSIDTLRADHLSCYGYERTTSPNLDALVARGALFERAYSSAPWTLPSYGSLFTGLLPADHRVGVVGEREAAFGTDDDPARRTMELMRPDVTTLAEVLTRRGYETAAFVCNPYLNPASGIARGFHSYTSYQYTSKNGVDLVLPWLRARAQSRWFLMLHVIDPHMPYAPPRPFDTRWSKTSIDELPDWPPKFLDLREKEPDAVTKQLCVDFYDGEIAYTDDQIGRLLAEMKAAGLLENTIVVLHSDHGEELWDHGNVNHGHTQYEELLRVPLAVVWEGRVPQKRVATRVRTLDLFPTIAELVGGATPPGLAGQSLVPVWKGDETADRDVIAEAVLHNPREIKALLAKDDKLIATGAQHVELYDLRSDPTERTNRVADAQNAAEAQKIVALLRQVLVERHARILATPRTRVELQLDAGTRQRLSNIGYAGEDEARPTKPAPK